MSEKINSTELKCDGLRAILPARWWPILVWAALVVGISLLGNFGATQAQREQYLRAIHWSGFATLAALVSLMNLGVVLRPLLLLGIAILPSILDILSPWDPTGSRWSYLVQSFLFYLRSFAAVTVIMYSIAAIGGIRAMSASTMQIPSPKRRQRSLVREWFYFSVLVALTVAPPIFRERQSHFSITGHFLETLSYPFSDFSITSVPVYGEVLLACLPFLGLQVLLVRTTWWFRVILALGLLLPVALISISLCEPFFWEGKARLSDCFELFFAFLPYSVISLPHWLLLRVAGYRFYSRRKWIGGGATLESSSSIVPITESPFR